MSASLKDRGSKPGRVPRISRQEIAEAALEIGLDAATITEIGRRLGVDHSSLYRHVRNRNEIVLAAADLAIGRLDWRAATSDWRAYLENIAEKMWDLYEDNPGLAEAIRNLEKTPSEGIRAFAEAVGGLQERGFALEDALIVLDSVMDMTVDSFYGWRRMTSPVSDNASIRDSLIGAWTEEAAINPTSAAPIAKIVDAMSDQPKRWWRKKLALLLDGASVRRQ